MVEVPSHQVQWPLGFPRLHLVGGDVGTPCHRAPQALASSALVISSSACNNEEHSSACSQATIGSSSLSSALSG